VLNNTKTQSRPKLLGYQLLVKPIKILKILKNFLSRPRPRPRPRLLPQDQDQDQDSGSQDQDQDQEDFIFVVLEAPRDQDFGLEDYICGETAFHHKTYVP